MQTGIRETEMTINTCILDDAPAEELLDVETRAPQDYPPDEEPKYGQLNKEISESFNAMHGEGGEDESFEDTNSIARHEDLLHHTCDNLLIDYQPTDLQDALGTASSVDDVPENIIASGAATVAKAVNSFKPNAYTDVQTYLGKDIKDCELADIEKGEKLLEQLNLFEAFTDLSVTGCLTHIRVLLGKVLIRLKRLVKEFTDENWEEFANEAFPYLPKSTRCMYMRLGSVPGVEGYTFLGSEFLRKVVTATQKAKVDGPDHIKALFEKNAEECDLGISHKEFKAKLKSILDHVLKDGAEDTDGSGDAETKTEVEGADDTGTDTEANTDDEGSAGSENDVEDITEGESSDDSENDGDVTGENEDSSKETVTPGATQKPPVKDGGYENENKKILDEDSVSHILANFNSSVRGLLELAPPKEAFDIKLIEDAKELLGKLESFVKGERQI